MFKVYIREKPFNLGKIFLKIKFITKNNIKFQKKEKNVLKI